MKMELGLELRYVYLIEYWAQTHVNITPTLMLGTAFHFLPTTNPMVCDVYEVITYITVIKLRPNKFS